jgi:MHS family citrate/tricarballylate:H+ symporter-like MFS transporter
MIVPLIFFIRRSLQETAEFKARKEHPNVRQILDSMIENAGTVLAGMMLVLMTTVSFYLITVYTPTYGKTVLHLTEADSLTVTLCVGISNFIWLPLTGALSDRIGRKPILVAATILTIVSSYPILSWLVSDISFGRMLGVELWLSFLYGTYNGAMVVTLTEVIPVRVRTAGFSMAYSLATTIGGLTPFVCTWLIDRTGDKAAPGLWMSVAAACGLAATLILVRDKEKIAVAVP